MKLMENILTLVCNMIKASLNAKLVAIQAEHGDGIVLNPPLATSYAINELGAIDQLPFIQILPVVSDVLIPANTWDEIDHKIIVIAHTVSYEGKIDWCAKRTYRFARAIWELILADRTLGSKVIGTQVDGIDYKPMQTDGNEFAQSVWLNCTVKMNEI